MKNVLAGLLALTSATLYSQKLDSLDLMIGQMIMIGIGDFDVLKKGAPVFQTVEQGQVGGIILFEKNVSNQYPKTYLKEIIDHAQSVAPIPLLVSIDEEGGKVTRLKEKYGFPKTVTAQYLGELDNMDSTRYYAYQTASTLKELGINLNYAPSLDVNVNPKNPVIGSVGRSFSSDHIKVIEHGSEVMKVHHGQGVITAIKHFPGHGSSQKDTHLGIADVSSSWQIQEIYPYKAILDSGLVKMVMTAHIVNDVLDKDKLPATLSKKVVDGLLRGFLDYDGVVISDDMQMGAISREYGLEQAIQLSINAGVDIVMFANNVPNSDMVTGDQIHGIIKKLVAEGTLPKERIIQSYNRIMALKADFAPPSIQKQD